ncbi:MAG TPA: Rieske 2Fe-2S domain-containing protein [Chloroflexota bacterium]|nr:Rieske 2Fe-2S domain-containing protein [Chloroflexota bacterium]HUM69676.1 Rieske 2Fe-2S domain-containing protein [Chloroflexota bacterium]
MQLFKSKATPDADGYFETVAAGAVQEGELTAVTINGRQLLLTRYEGRVHAFSAQCPHAAANLGDGWLSRFKITCPDHEYCFDMRNGRILWPTDENYRLKMFEVKESDGRVKVKM